jgi:hypothetical protein
MTRRSSYRLRVSGTSERLADQTTTHHVKNFEMTPTTHIAETVTIGGDLTVERIGYGATQLTGPMVWGGTPTMTKALRCYARRSRVRDLHRHR